MKAEHLSEIPCIWGMSKYILASGISLTYHYQVHNQHNLDRQGYHRSVKNNFEIYIFKENSRYFHLGREVLVSFTLEIII